MKIHANQIPFFIQKVSEWTERPVDSPKEALESVFPDPRYILLTRRNKIARAVSFYRATMTDQWFRYRGATRSPEDEEIISFDYFNIKKCLELGDFSDSYWENFFRKYSITPLRLAYEELANEYENTVRRVFQFIGLPADTKIPPPLTVRVSDERSEAWVREFLRLQNLESGSRYSKAQNR